MNIPILYVGAPGVGKTAIIRDKYDHCEVLLLSSQTEEDLAGIPYRDGPNEKRTIPPYIQRLQAAKGKKCLFLDEIDKARREVADTLLTLVTHPEHFGIPEDTHIVAAANPPEWGGGDGLSLPMMNRFAVVSFQPDFESWSAYMTKKHGESGFLKDLISKIEVQELPLLEANGEGLDWRMTSPRSIDNAVTVCLADIENMSALIEGLVTPNMASGLLTLFKKHIGKVVANDDDPQTISRSVGSRAIGKSIFRR